jgi:hypothetical protein
MKRMRKTGVTDPVTGEIVPFPRIPKVPRGRVTAALASR